MADTSADEFSEFPVESLARFLSVCGREDPGLLRRSPLASGAAAPRESNRRPLEPVSRESHLEELVSIAVASARQAEDAVRQVYAAGVRARRRMFALATLGVAGVCAGLAGVGCGYVRWVPQIASSATFRDARLPTRVAAAASAEPIAAPAAAPHAATPHTAFQVRLAEALPAAPDTEAAVTPPRSVAAMLSAQPPLPVTSPDPVTPEDTAAPADALTAPDKVTAPGTAAAPASERRAPAQVAETVAPAAAPSPDAAEAALHAAASVPAPAPAAPVQVATPPTPGRIAIASAAPEEPAPMFVAPHALPPQPNAVEAPRPPATHASVATVTRVHSSGGTRITPSRLVAAVQALESLTDEMPAPSRHQAAPPGLDNAAPGLNKRM